MKLSLSKSTWRSGDEPGTLLHGGILDGHRNVVIEELRRDICTWEWRDRDEALVIGHGGSETRHVHVGMEGLREDMCMWDCWG